MSKTVKNMLEEAFAKVPMVEPKEAMEWLNDSDTIFVDVRDTLSIQDTGKVKGAIHAERGMIEFFADQEHELGKEEMKPEKRVILYCGAGGQAALAGKTLMDMGYEKVFNVGSFKGWKDAGGPTD